MTCGAGCVAMEGVRGREGADGLGAGKDGSKIARDDWINGM